MQDLSNNSIWANPQPPRRFFGLTVASWAIMAVGAGATLAIINLTTIQPTMRQLAQMQGQVAALQSNIRQLAGQRGSVEATNSLLGQLAEQGRRNAEARASLDQISGLHHRLNQQTEQAERALEVMEKFAALQEAMIANAAKTAQASASLDEMEGLQNRLTMEQESSVAAAASLNDLVSLKRTVQEQAWEIAIARESLDGLVNLKTSLIFGIDDLARSREIVTQMQKLQGQLSIAGEQSSEARDTANQLLGMADELMCRGDATAARASLEDLIAIRERLEGQADGLDVASQRVGQLINLKDMALSQTSDLANATENLMLMADVQAQMNKLAGAFGRMRNWITEIIVFEPTLNRAMRTLQPLTELGKLQNMNAAELRQVVRSIDSRREAQSNDEAAVAAEPQTPAVNDAALAH